MYLRAEDLEALEPELRAICIRYHAARARGDARSFQQWLADWHADRAAWASDEFRAAIADGIPLEGGSVFKRPWR